MAQKKEQYEGAVDSIFNFIFSNNKKNASQKAPKRIEGVHGSEMAYALGEVAADPAIYASEQVLDAINEPLDNIVLAESSVKLDSQNAAKTKITLKSASGFFNNPEGFLDKAFQKTEDNKKAAKKLNMIRGFGGIMDLGIGAVVARSIGAPPIDSLEIGSVLGAGALNQNTRDNMAEELATRTSALEAARMKGLRYDDANKLAQTFTSVMESSRLNLAGKDVTNLSRAEKVRLQTLMSKKLSTHGISLTGSDFDNLLNKYGDRAKKYKNKEGYGWNLGDIDKSLSEGRRKGPNHIDAWIGSKNPADKLAALKFEELEARASLLPVGDPERIRLKGHINHIETWQLANSHRMRWSSYLGEASLNIQHFNELVLKGGAFPALISGDFFDGRKNHFTPSQEKAVSINGVTGKINVARDDQRAMYTRLNSLYYFTPGSIAKTLFVNGEGFLYRAHLKQERIRKAIRGSDTLYKYASANPSLFGANFFDGVDMSNQKEVLDRLALGENYVELLNVLNTNMGSISDPKLLELFSQMEKIQGKIKNSLGLKYAEKIQALFKNIEKISPKKLLEKGVLLILGKKLGSKLKEFFVDGAISLKSLARGLAKKGVHALAQALGFATTGGLANVLIYIATEVIYFVGEKLLKPMVKLMGFVLWAFGIIFFMLAFGVLNLVSALNPFSSVAGTFDTAGNTAPIFCERCGAASLVSDEDWSEETTYEDGGGGGGDTSVVPEEEWPEVPPDWYGGECPMGSGYFHCSQGPYAPGGSHCHSSTGPKPAIDIAYNGSSPPPDFWYAPSDGTIVSVSYDSRWGGVVRFRSESDGVLYTMIHGSAYNVSVGDSVSKGQPIASINKNLPVDSRYWTGAHWHLEVRDANGNWINAEIWYKDRLNCDIGSCWMGEGTCPHI